MKPTRCSSSSRQDPVVPEVGEEAAAVAEVAAAGRRNDAPGRHSSDTPRTSLRAGKPAARHRQHRGSPEPDADAADLGEPVFNLTNAGLGDRVTPAISIDYAF